jgi:hypothetical protein
METTTTIDNVKGWILKDGTLTVVHYIPKDGDVMYSEWNVPWSEEKRWVITIQKGEYRGADKKMSSYVKLSNESGLIMDGYIGIDYSRTDRPATEEQCTILEEALRRDGKRWNAEKGCVENVGAERTMKEEFWFICSDGRPGSEIDCGIVPDNERFELGNYFSTRKEAEEFFKKEIRPVYQKRHNR